MHEQVEAFDNTFKPSPRTQSLEIMTESSRMMCMASCNLAFGFSGNICVQ